MERRRGHYPHRIPRVGAIRDGRDQRLLSGTEDGPHPTGCGWSRQAQRNGLQGVYEVSVSHSGIRKLLAERERIESMVRARVVTGRRTQPTMVDLERGSADSC